MHEMKFTFAISSVHKQTLYLNLDNSFVSYGQYMPFYKSINDTAINTLM